jgi:hypothetical protein
MIKVDSVDIFHLDIRNLPFYLSEPVTLDYVGMIQVRADPRFGHETVLVDVGGHFQHFNDPEHFERFILDLVYPRHAPFGDGGYDDIVIYPVAGS